MAAAQASSGSLLTYLLAGALIFTFGYARAVWVRARKDYKATKAAVKPLRKAMWGAIFKAIRLGTVVVVIGLLLGAWVVHDTRAGDRQPVPARDVISSCPSPPARPKATTRAARRAAASAAARRTGCPRPRVSATAHR